MLKVVVNVNTDGSILIVLGVCISFLHVPVFGPVIVKSLSLSVGVVVAVCVVVVLVPALVLVLEGKGSKYPNLMWALFCSALKSILESSH